MVQINFARREVNCKIVYYGPGLSGKTTNLEKVHELAPREHCGKLTSIATEGDRTLFFDFMPLSLGKVAGMDTKFQLYTVPGQTFYESTRRLVLQGADGVVFVADSQKDKFDENLESFDNLRRNLKENGLNMEEMPLVIQYNKRDLPDIVDVKTLDKALNTSAWPHHEAVAVKGTGVMQTLKIVSGLVLETLNTRNRKTRRLSGTTAIIKPASKTEESAIVTNAGSDRRQPHLVGTASRAARPATASSMRSPRTQRQRTERYGAAAPGTRTVSTPPPAGPQSARADNVTPIRATRDTRHFQPYEKKNNNRLWIAAAITVGATAALIGLLLMALN